MKNHLEDIPKQDPFEVPAGYFDELPQRVQKRIAGQPRTVFLPWAKQWQWAAATAFVVVIGVWGARAWWQASSTNPQQTAQYEPLLSDVSKQDVAEFLMNEDLNSEEIMDWADENNVNVTLQENLPEEISAEELEEFVDLEELEYM